MRKTSAAVAVTAALVATAAPAWAVRVVPTVAPVTVDMTAPVCGPAGWTVLEVEIGAHETSGAWLKVERRRSVRIRPVVTPGGGTKSLRYRVAAGRPLSITVHQGREVIASTQLSGHPCQ